MKYAGKENWVATWRIIVLCFASTRDVLQPPPLARQRDQQRIQRPDDAESGDYRVRAKDRSLPADPCPVLALHSGLLSGHLGDSLVSGISIAAIFKNSIGYTLLLAGVALAVIFGVGVPVGMFAGAHEGSWIDHVVRGGASLLLAIPNFLLAIILVIVLGLHLHMLPGRRHGVLEELDPANGLLGSRAVRLNHPAHEDRLSRAGLLGPREDAACPAVYPNAGSAGGTSSGTR